MAVMSTPTDSLGFLDAVAGLPEQLRDARSLAGAQVGEAIARGALPPVGDIDNIVVLGMGGSGIAGDVLASVANSALPVPVTVLKQYRVPNFVGPRTLAFAVSYSGGTEETVSMAEGVVERGARLVVVTLGGALGALAQRSGAVHISCPEGFLPRAALGALIAPLFATLEGIGMLPDAGAWLADAQNQLASRRDQGAERGPRQETFGTRDVHRVRTGGDRAERASERHDDETRALLDDGFRHRHRLLGATRVRHRERERSRPDEPRRAVLLQHRDRHRQGRVRDRCEHVARDARTAHAEHDDVVDVAHRR